MTDHGRSDASASSGLRPDGLSQSSLSQAKPLVPNAGDWFCERGDFWGTIKQLCLCAKCGEGDRKRHDEPRHYFGVFTSKLHLLCDECFDALPDAKGLAA